MGVCPTHFLAKLKSHDISTNFMRNSFLGKGLTCYHGKHNKKYFRNFLFSYY